MKTVLLSAAVSLFIALFGTPLAIKTFSRRGKIGRASCRERVLDHV